MLHVYNHICDTGVSPTYVLHRKAGVIYVADACVIHVHSHVVHIKHVLQVWYN